MLFNSYVFIFAFLPIALLGFFLIGKYSHELSSLWLAAASLFFYGWWDMRFVWLLLCSIAFNYSAGYLLGKRTVKSSKMLLIGAIGSNLLLLGYFKYANFFASSINSLAGSSLPISEIILPLGISFFTFTQIAFLVDTYQGKVKEFNFTHYALFVTYFPHLIAGPVLHHTEMMPQFAKRAASHLNWSNVSVGLTIFILGLAKKVLLADSLADYATPIFEAVRAGGHPMPFEAWVGSLAYTLQLYFDFSAYSDMAIGLSLMFNVRLPINFFSPYKATSIIEFWRRWHMTLSRFLRDYLYIPLGGNRNGPVQRHFNLIVTMLIGGLWHGAAWTFVIWGGLHGIYLIVNHAWRTFKRSRSWGEGGTLAKLAAGGTTFLAVMVGWVFFRSENVDLAFEMLQAMAGFSQVSNLNTTFGDMLMTGLNSGQAINTLLIGLLIAFGLPNLQQVFHRFEPSLISDERLASAPIGWGARYFVWQAKPIYAWLSGLLFVYVVLNLTRASEFLYFQF